MAKGMSMKVLLQLQTKEFQKGLRGIQKQLNGFKNFMKSAFALGSITMFGRELVQVGKDFENAMARVQAVSNATQAEFKAMQEEAQKMGSTTRYTATEAAEALENLTRNGMSAANATKALSNVLQLAQANAIGLSDAANIITNVLNMFNLGVGQASRVNDVLSSTASHAATDITNLYDAMVNAAPAANVLGFSLEETASAIGALAQRGVKGSEAGTKLRIAFQKMADPKVIGKMKDYGIAVDENSMKVEGLKATIEKIAAADLSLGQLGKIFDAKSAMAVQQLVASLEDLDYMLEVTANSAGETERMFNQGVGTVQKELDTLKSMYEGLLISISQQTSGVVKGVVKLLQNLIGNFETVGGTIMNIASVAVPLLTKRVITLGTTLKTMFTQAAAGAATLKVAMGDWITIIATLVTWVGTALVGAWNEANRAMREANAQMVEAKAKANDLQNSVKKLKEKIGDGSDTASLTSAVKEATRLFPEFAKAINDAAKIAAATENWNKLKGVIQDIADLQSIVLEKEAKTALANAKAAKLGRQMYEEGAPLNLNPEVRAAQNIRSSLKDSGFDKEGIISIFTEIAKRASLADSGEDAFKEVSNYLRDGLEVELDDTQLRTWLNRFIDVIPSPPSSQSGRENMSSLQGTQRDLKSLSDEERTSRYNRYKEDFENTEKITKEELGDIKKHQTEYNKRMYDAAQDFYNKVIDLGFPPESKEMKEAVDILKRFPKPTPPKTNDGGDGSNSKTPKVKTDVDKVKEAVDGYNDEATKLNNRLKANTISVEDYNAQMDKLEDKTWEAITAISNFSDILAQLGQTKFGDDLQSEYSENRSNDAFKEATDKIAKQFGGLADYVVPKKDDRSRRYDKKTQSEKWEEDLKIEIEYEGALKRLITDFQTAIDKGEFDLVKDDAIDMLETLKTKAQEAAAEADNLQAKLDLSNVIVKLDEQINALNQTTLKTLEGFANSMDRIVGGLWAIAEVFDEDLKDSPMFQAFEAFSTILNQSIQIMQGVVSAIQLVKAIQTKAALQKVKDASVEVAANEAVTTSELEKAAAEGAAAAAGGASSVSSIPVVGPALAVAAVAAIAAAIAAAVSKMKGFAHGGLVGGHSYSGDNVPAMVNSGEMILNRNQQATLFNAINSGKLGGGGKVEFVIRGDQLVGTIQNYNRLRK